jgi:ABC-type amino acid transport substrate-binding protein
MALRRLVLTVLAAWACMAPGQALAQSGPKPDWSWLPALRVVTEPDYPPFNYYDEEGQLTGFNVDLARAICRELSVTCDITSAEWSTLIPSLKSGEADAILASVAISPKSVGEVEFTNRYYSTPARFAAKAGSSIGEISVAELSGRKIAVVKGTAHEAFLRDFFEGARRSRTERWTCSSATAFRSCSGFRARTARAAASSRARAITNRAISATVLASR